MDKIETLKNKAQTGDINAALLLSSYYKANKNFVEMLKYYELAANNGSKLAKCELTSFYAKINDHQNMFKYFDSAINYKYGCPYEYHINATKC